MEKNLSSNKKNNFLNDIHLQKGIEIQSNKILPHLEKRNSQRFRKDEWEQEYFIIYNSYVLEDKESESYSD
jgi:hypothetical protein